MDYFLAILPQALPVLQTKPFGFVLPAKAGIHAFLYCSLNCREGKLPNLLMHGFPVKPGMT